MQYIQFIIINFFLESLGKNSLIFELFFINLTFLSKLNLSNISDLFLIYVKELK